jgi:hypothetical protein
VAHRAMADDDVTVKQVADQALEEALDYLLASLESVGG